MHAVLTPFAFQPFCLPVVCGHQLCWRAVIPPELGHRAAAGVRRPALLLGTSAEEGLRVVSSGQHRGVPQAGRSLVLPQPFSLGRACLRAGDLQAPDGLGFRDRLEVTVWADKGFR